MIGNSSIGVLCSHVWHWSSCWKCGAVSGPLTGGPFSSFTSVWTLLPPTSLPHPLASILSWTSSPTGTTTRTSSPSRFLFGCWSRLAVSGFTLGARTLPESKLSVIKLACSSQVACPAMLPTSSSRGKKNYVRNSFLKVLEYTGTSYTCTCLEWFSTTGHWSKESETSTRPSS